MTAGGTSTGGHFDPGVASQTVQVSNNGSVTALQMGISKTGARGLSLSGVLLGAQGETFVAGSASAQMSYSFMITGGAGQTFVPIAIHEQGGLTHSEFQPGEIFTSGDQGAFATTTLNLLDQGNREYTFAQSEVNFTNDGGPGDLAIGGGTNPSPKVRFADQADHFTAISQAFDTTVTLDDPAFNELKTNTLYTMNLNMDYFDGLGGVGAEASDQTVAFSSFMTASFGFAEGFDATGYQIEFSDGFGPPVVGTGPGGGTGGPGGGGPGGGVGGVPEPATWALLVGGFGFAGAALRRRRGVRKALA